jgi:hypothetical protein
MNENRREMLLITKIRLRKSSKLIEESNYEDNQMKITVQ